MRKVNTILLFAVVFSVFNAIGYSGTIDASYEVGTWQGFCPAAITYTFDDNCTYQYTVAIPMFNQYDFDATFFLVTDWVGDWTPWQNAAAEGHEIASHTATHSRLHGPGQEAEFSVSKDTINANIPGNQCLTIAYPNCQSGDMTLLAQYYIAGRNCSGGVNPPTPGDFFEIKAKICGDRGSLQTLSDFITYNEAAVAAGGWQMYLIHDLDDGSGYSPLDSTVLQESLAYLDGLRSTYWVDTFLNVVRYIKERDDVSLTEVANQGSSITLQITDTLDDVVYNHPVTFRRPLPTGWASAIVTQNGQQVSSSIVIIGSITYIMFDAVPDAGDVVLLEGSGDTTPPAAPTNLSASAVSATQIDLDWDDNSESDLAGYIVYRDGYEIASSVSASQYSDTGLSPTTQYCYTVSAVDFSSNESNESNTACATTQEGSGDTTPPAAPTGLAAAAGNGTVSLDWDDNTEPDLDSYTVYRSTTQGTGYSAIAAGMTGSAYADNTVTNGTTYYYVVTASDTSGNESANSGQVSATPMGGSGTTMHVDSINLWTSGGKNKTAVASVTIVDAAGAPVANATVSGTFTGDYSETRSGVTDDTGNIQIQTIGTASGNAHFDFCVDGVTHALLTYNAVENAETCESK